MASFNTLNCLIPRPLRAICDEQNVFPLKKLRSFFMDRAFSGWTEEFVRRMAFLGIAVRKSASSGKADCLFRLDPSLGKEALSLEITPERISVSGGDPAGLFYGMNALTQMIAAASAEDYDNRLNCGTVTDAPQFHFRSFMIDSARHFQSVSTLKKLIRHLAHYRINVLHWHLTDSQSWRTPSKLLPRLSEIGDMAPGAYSQKDLDEVVSYAEKHYMQVIPEIDIPGHCHALLRVNPELGCKGSTRNRELCIGSPAVRTFAKKLLKEFAGLFPKSTVIHLGGDEAETKDWEACPVCRKALKQKKLNTMRQLEQDFMLEMTGCVRSLGKTPALWCTPNVYPKEILSYSWQNVPDSLIAYQQGSPMVYALHTNYYFDYPAELEERHCEDWIHDLSEKDVYQTVPFGGWDPARGGQWTGTEACLWTEFVPERRLMRKILPRLAAYAESAWTPAWRKNWTLFHAARTILDSAACEDLWD